MCGRIYDRSVISSAVAYIKRLLDYSKRNVNKNPFSIKSMPLFFIYYELLVIINIMHFILVNQSLLIHILN